MTDAVRGIAGLGPEHGPLLLVVGIFDGLHRGHLYLLRELRRAARRMGARPAVLTFDHHPDEVVAGAAPPLLCDPEERLVRLARAGVAVTIVEHFDAALRETTYDAFVERIRERTTLAGFLMTPDAAFGYERRGTPAALAALGRRDGFDVAVVPPFDLDGQPVRSTEVRSAIAAGDLAAARRLLGRRVAVTGIASRVREGSATRLRWPLPVALPPPGDYRVTVEAGWSPGIRHVPARRGTATVGWDGQLRVHARRDALAHERLRVAFDGLLPAVAPPRPALDMPDELFGGRPLGPAVLARVRDVLAAFAPIEVRTSRSQVALRRRRGFAYLWPPDRYLANAGPEVVLSIALGREDASPRFKQVVRVSRRHWLHHLEIRAEAEIDEQVAAWLREAAERAR